MSTLLKYVSFYDLVRIFLIVLIIDKAVRLSLYLLFLAGKSLILLFTFGLTFGNHTFYLLNRSIHLVYKSIHVLTQAFRRILFILFFRSKLRKK